MYRGYFTRDPADVEDEEEYEARKRREEKDIDDYIDRKNEERRMEEKENVQVWS